MGGRGKTNVADSRQVRAFFFSVSSPAQELAIVAPDGGDVSLRVVFLDRDPAVVPDFGQPGQHGPNVQAAQSVGDKSAFR